MLNIRLSATCSYMCQENVKYAVRLRNRGQRTRNGDAGMNRVKCPDGTVFTFSSCSLSSNGTNQSRGQIPLIYYYRLVALSVAPCGLWGCNNRVQAAIPTATVPTTAILTDASEKAQLTITLTLTLTLTLTRTVTLSLTVILTLTHCITHLEMSE